MRSICKICKKRPAAVNYRKNNNLYYRSKCDYCSKNKSIEKTYWQLAGYQKKNSCDKCGYTSKYHEQFNVFFVDGNETNCNFSNIKTVCANCQQILYKLKLTWKQGDLKPDF